MNGLFALLLAAQACAMVKPSSPPQYLAYERRGDAKPLRSGESREHVWFRFHNNTTCPVKIPAATLFLMRTLPDGRITDEPPDGQELSVDVSFTYPQTGAALYLGPANLIGVVPARQSIVFRVPANRLKHGPIGLPFRYAFEDYAGGLPSLGDIVHGVVFDPKYLDADVRAWISRVEDPPTDSVPAGGAGTERGQPGPTRP